ncbi:hypothetical protein OQA88_13432 [Cercophora sp. LCS_1]
MAPLVKVPTPEDLKALETAYNGLRAARERLEAANLDIYHLLGLKCVHATSPEESESLSQLALQHKIAAFGKQNPWSMNPDIGHQRKRFLDSSELVDQELDRANASKAQLETVHNALRCCIDQLSRPFVRKLSLVDFPDEILLEIFTHLEDHVFRAFEKYPYSRWHSSRDIKSLRLVCRRVSNISSQLLVRVFHFDFSQQSLQRLEEISRHPVVSKGVHIIHVNLSFYNGSFAEPEEFLAFYGQDVEQQVGIYERSKLLQSSVTEEAAAEKIAKGRELVATLYRLWSGALSEGDEQYQLHINESHRLYLELLHKQDALLESDVFYQAAGSAIARMPQARALVFDDRASGPDLESRVIMARDGDIWERLRACMLQTLSGRTAERNQLELPKRGCILRLIDAFRGAGVFLHHLDLRLDYLGQSVDLAPSADLQPLFLSGMQQLESFSLQLEFFRGDDDSDDGEDGGEDEQGLCQFVSTCLATSSLKALSLHVRPGGEWFRMSLQETVCQGKPLNGLAEVDLGQLDFDCADLIAFVRRLTKPLCRFSMTGVHLRNGSWGDVLDALREHKPKLVSLRTPSGAECDNISLGDRQRLFGTGTWGHRTDVDAYIAGIPLPNPIRALQDGSPDFESEEDDLDPDEDDAMDTEG